MNVLFAIATGIMFGIGVYQVLRRDLIKAAFGFYILFTAINLFLLAAGAFNGTAPAYVNADNQVVGGISSDPVVQALLLTAIVISFGSYALLLSFIVISSRRFKTVNSDKVNELQR